MTAPGQVWCVPLSEMMPGVGRLARSRPNGPRGFVALRPRFKAHCAPPAASPGTTSPADRSASPAIWMNLLRMAGGTTTWPPSVPSSPSPSPSGCCWAGDCAAWKSCGVFRPSVPVPVPAHVPQYSKQRAVRRVRAWACARMCEREQLRTRRVNGSASHNLFIVSKRDPENSPEQKKFIYLYGNH